ncbi:MAG: hypothetical protein QHH06_07080 [Clostridiales bacterium]|jgi:hypothetical protein|nr:hypothetical protein [Eubacteriales bacterium]MDH7566230.1 hypothetical protein [Clostridiales bacterium]
MKKATITKRVLGFTMALAMMLSMFSTTAFATTPPRSAYDLGVNGNDWTIVADQNTVLDPITVFAYSDNTYMNTFSFDSDEYQYIHWTSSNPSVATVNPAGYSDTATITTGSTEGEATIYINYDNEIDTDVTIPINVVVEGTTVTDSVDNVNVSIDGTGDALGNPDTNFTLTGVDVPLFSLKDDVFGSGFDDGDVLKKTPTALHALLYALELHNGGHGTSDITDPNWNWDWVQNNVTVDYQGTYVVTIDGDSWSWEYNIGGGTPPAQSASIYKLAGGESVNWVY